MKKILVAATISGEAGRAYLSGVFDYSNCGKPWSLEVVDDLGSLDDRIRQGERPDGAIILFPHQSLTVGMLNRFKFPTVISDYPPAGFSEAKTPVSFVRLDNEAIGRAAAAHLLSRGRFNSYVCVIDEPQYKYPYCREHGFREALAATSPKVRTLIIRNDNATDRSIDEFQLRLSRLPRPLGVFAVRDRAALKVFDACRRFGLSVPEEVAVIGVDNDELFCNTTPVTLSSILPDHREVGRLAAQELNRLMRGRSGGDRIFDKSVKEIVLRASTRIVPPAAHIVSDILNYIEKNASGSLRVADVTAALGINRRLADLRFRQIRGESILTAIVRARLGIIKKRLISTSDPISAISARCDFTSTSAFIRFFKAHTGKTPLQWQAGM